LRQTVPVWGVTLQSKSHDGKQKGCQGPSAKLPRSDFKTVHLNVLRRAGFIGRKTDPIDSGVVVGQSDGTRQRPHAAVDLSSSEVDLCLGCFSFEPPPKIDEP
jgi:hypothetical protein